MQFERLLESIRDIPIATVITDTRLPDNPLVAVNDAFCRLTGYSEAEILGRNCRFLAGPDTERDAQATLREAIVAGRPAITELTNYRKDGTAFCNAVMIAPVQGPDGAPAFYLGSQMDVGTGNLSTPRRARAQEQVQALTVRQRQVLEEMIRGLRNKQIAAVYGIDEKTVKMHRAAMLGRLGVSSSAEAIRIGVEAGLAISGRD